MEYTKLLQYALANPVLGKAIQKMADESGVLNLVDPDWEAKLNAYPIHQLHKEKRVPFSKGKACSQEAAYVQNIALPAHSYKAIVLGGWLCERIKSKDLDSPPGDLSFVARDCAPLTAMALAMADNPNQKLHDGARMFMEVCSPFLCHQCSTQHKKFNIPCDPTKNWCVIKTRMFDGHVLNNVFKKQLEQFLENRLFLAVCQVNVYSRTKFGEDKFKVGGKIKDIIIFQESSIKPNVEMVFMTNPEQALPPAIEFPEADMEDEEEIIDARSNH